MSDAFSNADLENEFNGGVAVFGGEEAFIEYLGEFNGPLQELLKAEALLEIPDDCDIWPQCVGNPEQVEELEELMIQLAKILDGTSFTISVVQVLGAFLIAKDCGAALLTGGALLPACGASLFAVTTAGLLSDGLDIASLMALTAGEFIAGDMGYRPSTGEILVSQDFVVALMADGSAVIPIWPFTTGLYSAGEDVAELIYGVFRGTHLRWLTGGNEVWGETIFVFHTRPFGFHWENRKNGRIE